MQKRRPQIEAGGMLWVTNEGKPVRKSHQVDGNQKVGVPEPSRAAEITVPILQHLSKGKLSLCSHLAILF